MTQKRPLESLTKCAVLPAPEIIKPWTVPETFHIAGALKLVESVETLFRRLSAPSNKNLLWFSRVAFFFVVHFYPSFAFHPLPCHGCYPLCLYVHPLSDNCNDIHLELNAFTLIFYFESCCLHHSLGLDCILLSPACSRSAFRFMMKVA